MWWQWVKEQLSHDYARTAPDFLDLTTADGGRSVRASVELAARLPDGSALPHHGKPFLLAVARGALVGKLFSDRRTAFNAKCPQPSPSHCAAPSAFSLRTTSH